MLLFTVFLVSQSRLGVFCSWDRCSSGGIFTPHEQKQKWHRAQGKAGLAAGWMLGLRSSVQKWGVIWKAFTRWSDEGRTTKSKNSWTEWFITDQTVEKDWKLGVLADWGKRVSRPCLWKICHTLSLCLSLCFLFCHMLLPYEALPHHGPNAAKATDCG